MTAGGASAPDARGMRGALDTLGERLGVLASTDFGLDDLSAHQASAIVVVAAGDDALDAAAVVDEVAGSASVPVLVHRGESLPGWVDAAAVVVVVALTRVDARSRRALESARARDATVVVVTATTSFANDAEGLGAKSILVDPTYVTPRLVPGVSLVVLVRLFASLGHLATGDGLLRACLEVAVETSTACARPSVGRERSEPAALARRIGRTFPIVYGASGMGANAAKWWKSAVNQSAKLFAVADAVPDMAYSELAMFGQGGDVTRQVFTMVLLRAPVDAESALANAQLDVFEELFGEVVQRIETVASDAEGLGVYLDLALRGMWVGYEMATLAGVDPSALSILDEFWADMNH